VAPPPAASGGLALTVEHLQKSFGDNRVLRDLSLHVPAGQFVLMIEDGEIALDQPVDLPRPRERGSAEVAALEGAILHHLFRNSRPGEDA
jgi:sulfonate transport system ATP-binding protein